jgi:hypothetical protein
MFNWPRLRALVLRVFGLLIFAVAALAAFGLVSYGVAGPQSWFVNAAESFAGWVSAPLSSGTAVLVGVGLLVLAAFLAVVMVPRRPRTLPVLREDESGTTLLDLVSVAEAIEFRLRSEVDSAIGVEVKGGHLRVVTPFFPGRPFELVDEAGTSVKQQLAGLGLADSIEYEVTTGRETKRRVR